MPPINPSRPKQARSARVDLKHRDETTRDRLKSNAMDLFSSRGIYGVSVRDITAAAGAKNSAALHYYFGTKDDLIHELVVDAAIRSDRARNDRLDVLEAGNGDLTAEDVVRVIIEVETIGTGDHEQIAEPPVGFGHMRFVTAMQLDHRDKFMSAIDGRYDSSYIRCLEIIRRACPGISPEIINQRLVFMFLFINAALSAREASFIRDPTGGALWGDGRALENLVGVVTSAFTAAGGLAANPRPDTAASGR